MGEFSTKFDEELVSRSPILQFLDQRQVPWRATVGYFVNQWGIQRDPYYEWPILYLSNVGDFLEGCLMPLNRPFDDSFAAGQIVGEFSTLVYRSLDEWENYALAVSQIAHALGEGEEFRFGNSMRREWKQQEVGKITATIWPRDWQHDMQPSPVEMKYPFLAMACRVSVDLKLIAEPSAEELEWLATAETFLIAETMKLERGYGQFEREFLRRNRRRSKPGSVSISRDGEALILGIDERFCRIIRRQRVLSVERRDAAEERGPGWDATLRMIVPCEFGDNESKEVPLAWEYRRSLRERDAARDLDRLEQHLSERGFVISKS